VGNRLLEGTGIVALSLPQEFTAIVIITGKTDLIFIDPDQTTVITAGNTNRFGIDLDQTTLIPLGG
jgi:hypothetical protein